MLRLFLALVLVAAAHAQTSVVGEGGGASDLDALTDVTLTSETTDDVLSYDGSAWVNKNILTAIGDASGDLVLDDGTITDPTLVFSSNPTTGWSYGGHVSSWYYLASGLRTIRLASPGLGYVMSITTATSDTNDTLRVGDNTLSPVRGGFRVKSDGYWRFYSGTTGTNRADFFGNITFHDNTATTGVTSILVKAGAGQSTNDLQQWQDNAGNVLGKITSDGYGALPAVQLVDPGTKPACSSDTRGMIWYDAGGAGVADTAEICGKDASDVYAWVAIATF